MKVTRYQLRKIILEEAMRTRPIELYSDEELMQEGLIDWLKNLWKGLKAEFNKRISSSTASATKTLAKFTGGGQDIHVDVAAIAKKYGVDGIKTINDLNLKDKTHQKIFFASVSDMSLKFIAADMEMLQDLAIVKDWTPKSSSDEDLKAWKNSEGKYEAKLWEIHGDLAAVLGWLGTEVYLQQKRLLQLEML